MTVSGLPSGWLPEPEATSPERVLVALSGGVDSSVAAALLVEAGHQVVGVWMRLHDAADRVDSGRKSCCTLDAADDARRVADQLKIPFHIQNLEREFADAVLEPFVGAYLDGETPSPCVGCNTAVKFGALVGKGSALFGCEAVATGHYARRAVSADGRSWRLRTAVDHDKDQTYFLHGLKSDAIARARFPLGGMTKVEVREAARTRGLATAEKPESQEICFVGKGSYADFVAKRRPGVERPGEIVAESGEVIGEHRGLVHHTVGQRRGLGIAAGEPLYVLQLDTAANRLMVGSRERAVARRVEAAAVTLTSDRWPSAPFACDAMVRYRGQRVAATVTPGPAGSGTATIAFAGPDGSLPIASPGQAIVFYDGDEVLGGGDIRVVERAAISAPAPV